MLEFKRRSGIVIPRKYENELFYHNVKSALVRRSKNYNTEDYVYHRFYLESDRFLIIPRFFPLHEYVDCKIIDESQQGENISIKHSIVPRNEVQENAINFLLGHDQGILQLQPGVGKTVITIRKIAELGKKTLVLVHRDSLADQWRGPGRDGELQGLLDFTNLSPKDVGRITSANFEKALQKPVVIVTDQTFGSLLKRKRYEFLVALNKANIGFFVADEVHTSVGAPTFSECSIHISAREVLGLSATPYRYDGNGDIIEFHLGKVYADEDPEGTMDSRVTVVMFDYEIDTPKRRRYIHWEGQFQRSRYLNLLRKSHRCIEISKALLIKLRKDRNVLFISERINFIDILFSWLNGNNKSKFIAGSSLDELKKKITFSTPMKIRDGIDAPWKDAVVMTSPVKNIKQLCGRVCRGSSGKKTPIVIDMVDIGCRDIAETLYGRLDYYRERNWKVQFVLVGPDNKSIAVDEDMAMDILREV